MAKSIRGPRTGSGKKPRRKSPAAKKGPPVKKRRKKLVAKDKIGAVIIAAVLIAAAALGSLLVLYLHSARAPSDNSVAVVSPAVPAVTAGKNVETKTAAPPAPPVPAVQAAAAETAPQKTTAPAINAQPVRPVRPAPAGEGPLPVAAVTPGGVIERPPKSRGVLVFVIDDAGYKLRDLEPFLAFPGPLTIAVLPGLPYSAEAARRVRAAGKELFLHQPMEALGGQNPGPGAIRAGMGRDEIRETINRNLEEIGPVAGINNHEGSRVTMDEDAMETVLALCREKGLLFLDSRTTAETAVPKAALRLGMTILERNFFLDNNQDRESINGYINSALARAEKNGSAVCIGHVQTAGLAPLLAELYPSLVERGYTFSSASKLINGKGL